MTPPRRDGYYSDEDSGGTATVPVVPTGAAGTDSQVTAQQNAQAAAGQPGAPPADPTAPLGDGSGAIDSALTGPGTDGSSGPLFGDANSALTGLQNPSNAPAQTDYTGTYHNITEQDYKQDRSWDKSIGDSWGIGPISHNDLDRMHFGIEEPAKIAAAQSASTKGRQQLEQLASTINGGDIDAVGTADDILKPGEAGLQFFQFFAPAYNDWKGGGITFDAAKQAYEAEYGMSFADYSADSKTMADLSQQLVTIQQGLNNSYNGLVPTWQGDAASNFEAKMAAFFKASSTVTQDVATAGKDVAALVTGLQQLVLAKAQTVSELYADSLPNGIDGVMAQSLVKVAKGDGDLRMNLTAFMLLGGKIDPQSFVDKLFDPFGEFEMKLQAASMAPQMATQWCNAVLVPQFEGREQALNSVNSETTQRIQQGFTAFTGQLNGIADPFTAVDEAKAPKPAGAPTSPAASGGASGAGGGGGAPSVGGVASSGGGVPSSGGVPTGLPSGVPSTSPSTSPSMTGTDPSTTVPAATLATPATTPGTGIDPTTGLPTTTQSTGSPTDPTTGLPPGGDPTDPAGLLGGSTTTPPGTPGLPPMASGASGHHLISHHKNGSVSLGSDRNVTISPEHGKNGKFKLTSTDPDGSTHTYRVRFDKHGDPVVKEIHPHDDALDDTTSPAADLGGGIGGGIGGGGLGGLPSGGGGMPSGLGGDAGAHGTTHAGAGSGQSLQQGAEVGADNTMGAANAPSSTSPVAGSAAASAQPSDGHAAGGVGAMPMGAGMGGRAGGGEQESARKYQQHGDIVGKDDVEEWQRMGPVIGEQ